MNIELKIAHIKLEWIKPNFSYMVIKIGFVVFEYRNCKFGNYYSSIFAYSGEKTLRRTPHSKNVYCYF